MVEYQPKTRKLASRLSPSSNGYSDTLKFIVFTAGAAALLYLALQFGSSDNQYIRIGLWVAFLTIIIMAFRELFGTLRDYNLNFFTLPSTWLMLLVAVACIFLISGRQHSAAPLSTFDVISIAAILLFTAFSLFSNISKTNFIFGFILTLIQLLFAIVLVVIFGTITFLGGQPKGRRI